MDSRNMFDRNLVEVGKLMCRLQYRTIGDLTEIFRLFGECVMIMQKDEQMSAYARTAFDLLSESIRISIVANSSGFKHKDEVENVDRQITLLLNFLTQASANTRLQ